MYLVIHFVFRLINDTEIAKAQRDFELKKAAYDVEIQTKVLIFQFKIQNYNTLYFFFYVIFSN